MKNMKSKAKRIFLYLLAAVGLIIILLVIFVKTMLPNVGEPMDLAIEATPERLERGKYLANHVAVCIDCHSGRDWSSFSGPMIPGTEGQGGEIFDQSMGFPGKFVAKNITQYRLNDWTDGEIFRAITTGVSKDGSALFSIMPHRSYGQMDEEDVKSIIVYIRTLEPKENEPEASDPDFPMNLIINTIPQKADFTTIPPKTDEVNYGKYLVTTASCFDCHTKQEKGEFVGEPFAGGFEFLFPDGSTLQSANITPDSTGIGHWSKEQFLLRFKAYADSSYIPHKVGPGEFQTLMPWTFYAKMTDEDLSAIYSYLQTLPPVDNEIVLFKPGHKEVQ